MLFIKKNVSLVVGVIVFFVLIVAALSLILRFSSNEFEDKDSLQKIEYSDDITLNTSGLSSIKSINTTKCIFVKPKVNGDYLTLDFSDINIGDFLSSNHTQLKIAFDLIGFEGYLLPEMEICFNYKGFSENLEIKDVRLSPVSTTSVSCITSSKSADSSLLCNFDIPGVHKFEYVFLKNSDDTITVKVVFDEYSFSKVYDMDFSEMIISSVNIRLKGSSSNVALFAIENLSVGYVPSLSAFPGEAIVIPIDAASVELGNKANPVYGIYNKDNLTTLSNNNTLVISENVPINAYAGIYLTNDNKSINVFDYDYITIEYDVSVIDSISPVRFVGYLLGRPNGSLKQYSPSYTYFYVDENQIYGLNSEKTNMTESADKIHVKYVIAGDKFQLFLNDVLYYEAFEVFSETKNCIEELRINDFKNPGSVKFSNLKVYGYTVPTSN